MPATPSAELRELARSYGVQTEYVGMSGETEPAPAESLLAVLRALGADVAGEVDAPRAILARQEADWRRRVEPVVLAWDGTRPEIEVRLPDSLASTSIRCRIEAESGEVHEWRATARPMASGHAPGGFVAGLLGTPADLPTGYHRLILEFEDGLAFRAMIVAAPSRAYAKPGGGGKRPWGVFCPLYALHRESSWGAGRLLRPGGLDRVDGRAGRGDGGDACRCSRRTLTGRRRSSAPIRRPRGFSGTSFTSTSKRIPETGPLPRQRGICSPRKMPAARLTRSEKHLAWSITAGR